MNPNRFEYALTARDMAEAYKSARRRALRRFFSWQNVVALALFWALVVAVSICSDRLGSSGSAPAAPSPATQPSFVSDVLLPLAPWGIILAAAWLFIYWTYRRQYRNHRLIDRAFVLLVEADKITWTELFVRLEYQWPAFYGFKETKNLFLLYASDPKLPGILMFHIVPKRAFSSADQAGDFRGLLETNIHPPVSRFPVIQPVPAMAVNPDAQ